MSIAVRIFFLCSSFYSTASANTQHGWPKRLFILSKQSPWKLFNFLNQVRQVRFGERKLWRWDAVALEVRGNVFVMRISAGKRWIVRMRLWIVPIQLFGVLPDLVTIIQDVTRGKIHQF